MVRWSGAYVSECCAIIMTPTMHFKQLSCVRSQSIVYFPRENVANWLYGVALKTARKRRQQACRFRKCREKQVADMSDRCDANGNQRASRLEPVLDQESIAGCQEISYGDLSM